MNKYYVEKDLSIIIPTYGSNEQGLNNLIQAIREDSTNVKIVVVWDNVDHISVEQQSFFLLNNITVAVHGENKGRAAARNTGISYCTTLLGMFIDDDIVPLNSIISKVIDFHNNNLSEFDMVIGKVTWQ